MNSSRRARTLGLSTFAIALGLGAAAPAISSADQGLASKLGSGVTVSRQDATNKVGFIGTEPGAAIDVGVSPGSSAARVAKTFVADNARGFGLTGDGAALRVSETNPAAGDGTSVHLQQLQDGLPVLGGELVVDLDSNRDVLSVLGETSPSPDAAQPSVSAEDAATAALGAVGRAHDVDPDTLSAETPKLEIYDPRLLSAPGPLQTARTAWVVNVDSAGPVGDGEPIRELVVVDARLGNVALHFDQIETAKNRSVCDANNTSAQYPCTSPVWTEASQPGGVDADVPPAFDYAGDTYDFYFTRFGRDSLNGSGLPLVSTVDYCDPTQPCPYANAFWDGSQMVYGDGFAAADDVVGHEASHGFTEFTSHLFYYQQSGAINESMSDVFGEFIDQTNSGGTDTPAVKWLLGEDVPGFGAIRNMKNPPAFGDPDKMTSANYTTDVNEGDEGGVHSNSGVNNKAAYLITDGDTFNGQTITGIGITKAARIYYEVETSMLVSGSDYADLGNALNQACTNLIGTAGITTANCTNVAKAVTATEMATNPPNSPTVTAPTCTSGTPVNTFFDNLENTGSGNWTTGAIVGANSWFYPQNPNLFTGFDATYTTSGTKNIFGGDRSTVSDSFIRTTNPIAVPAGAFLRFNRSYGFDDDASGAYDGGVVEYSTNGASGPWTDAGSLFTSGSGYNGTITNAGSGNPLSGRPAFVRESNGYGASRLNLSSLAGQNVMFRFRTGSDSSVNDFGWFIDDVRVYTCPTTPVLSVADASKAEGDSGQSNANLTVTLGGVPAVSNVTVHYATSNGTATQPGDYLPSSGTLTFTPGQTTKSIPVSVVGDTVDEDDETVNVDLSAPTGGAVIGDDHADLTITDDDPSPAISIGDVAKAEGNSGASNADLAVSLSAASSRTVSVNYATADGTATQPSDYAPNSGTLTFTPGQTTQTVSVAINGDTAVEPDESLAVNLSAPVKATLGDAIGAVTITNDDAAVPPPPDTTAPETTIDSGPAKKTKKKKAKFEFSSSESGSSFECALDKASFAACSSPKNVTAKKGKHTFSVRAKDAAGNVDQSPATYSWKVKKKKKKHHGHHH